MYGQMKIAAHVFGVNSENESYSRHGAVETRPINKRVRTTTENQQIQDISSLFPHDMLFLFVQQTLLTRLSYPLFLLKTT